MIKRNLKKIFVSAICVMMLGSLAGCGSKDKDETTVAATTEATTTVADTTEDTGVIEGDTPTDSGEDTPTAATLGGKLSLEFKSEIEKGTDIYGIAEKLSDEKFCGYNCMINNVQEGFLNGFDEEIKGFKKGVMFAPMIGSIPFVTYIFETDDPNALQELLEAKANPRWNICTEAAETVCITSGNYVFFTMCPGEDQ